MATGGSESGFEEYWWKEIFGGENPLVDPLEDWNPSYSSDIPTLASGDGLPPFDLMLAPTTEVTVSIRTSNAAVPVPEVRTESAPKRKIKKEKQSDEDKAFLPQDEDDEIGISRITQIHKEIAKLKKELEAIKGDDSLDKDDRRRDSNRISAAISRRTKELAKLNAINEVAELNDKLKEANKQIQALQQANAVLQAENEMLKKQRESTVNETAVIVTVSSPSKKGYLPQFKGIQGASSLRASTGVVFEDRKLSARTTLTFSK